MSKLYILLAAVLVITSQTSRSVAQMVDRWDLCEDTTTMQFETFGPIFSAASPSDIAQIGLPIWRASSGRVLRHSSDSGRTWQEIFTKQEGWDRWISVVHPSASNYIIYGDTEDYYGQDRNGNYLNRYRAYFLLSSDVGATWTQMYLDTNTILRSVTMLTPTYGAAIVIHVSNVHDSLPGLLADDMIVTTDGWKSWTTHPFPSGVRGSQQLFCFRPGVFGVSTWLNSNGDSMRYLKTLDGGLTWQTHGSMPVVADIYFLNENLAWGAGTDWHVKPQNPLLIQTTDGGATWITRLDRDVSVLHWGEGLNQVAFGDSLHGIACGSRILETTDGGVTWSSNQPPFDAFSRQNGGMNIQGLIMPAANFALAVSGSPGIRFIGQQRLALPNLHEHDPGPMAIAPTTVAWVPVTGAVRYELQLAINPPWAGSAQKVFDYVSLDTVIADTLCSFTPIPAETYYARVRAIGQQSLDTSDWRWSGEWYQLLSMFNTVSKAGMQLPPRVLEPALGATVDGHVHLVWSSVPNAVSYAVRLAKADFTPPRYSTVMDTTLDVSDLTPNSTYYIQVEANMANDATDWSYNGYYFLTEPSANVPFVSTRDQLFVYPNPASDEVHISLGEDPAALRVRIIDLLGHVLHAPITAETGGFAIDVHALPFGVYEVVVSGKDTRTFRFVVEH